jgi:hypothetical protein
MKWAARRVRRLHAHNPYCHWGCGTKTKITEGRTTPLADDEATLDHLYDRFDPRRKAPRAPGEESTVLACYRCNHERGIESQKRNNPNPPRPKARRHRRRIHAEQQQATGDTT